MLMTVDRKLFSLSSSLSSFFFLPFMVLVSKLSSSLPFWFRASPSLSSSSLPFSYSNHNAKTRDVQCVAAVSLFPTFHRDGQQQNILYLRQIFSYNGHLVPMSSIPPMKIPHHHLSNNGSKSMYFSAWPAVPFK